MPAKHFCFKVKSPLPLQGAELGEGVCLGRVRLVCVLEILSAVSLVSLSQGMFRNAEERADMGGGLWQ